MKKENYKLSHGIILLIFVTIGLLFCMFGFFITVKGNSSFGKMFSLIGLIIVAVANFIKLMENKNERRI